MKAITFGSAMVDIITVISSEAIEQLSLSNSNRQYLLVEPGRKVEAETITRHIGGGALNAAVCLARLGCDASPVVKMGEDVPCDYIVKNALDHGLDASRFLIDKTQSTGSAVMIASHEKNAAIFTHRGANTTLVQHDLEKVEPLQADMVHAAPLSGASAKMLPAIARLANQAGAFFSCNPGIRQITTRTNSVLTASTHMSLISINEVEAAALVPCLSTLDANLDWGMPAANTPVIHAQGVDICLEKFCRTLHAHGPKNVLITHGAEGAYMYDGKRLHHQEVVPTDVAGTAGAGDAFVSTLTWGLSSGHPAKQALLQAAHNASSVVSHVNTTDGLLSADELMKRVLSIPTGSTPC